MSLAALEYLPYIFTPIFTHSFSQNPKKYFTVCGRDQASFYACTTNIKHALVIFSSIYDRTDVFIGF